MNLGPHRVVSRKNHTYSNNGIVVKATVASSWMLRAGVGTTGRSVPLVAPHLALQWYSERQHISFPLTLNLHHLQTFLNASLPSQGQRGGHVTCTAGQSPGLRRPHTWFNALPSQT